jgi:serine/threonine protein kinase
MYWIKGQLLKSDRYEVIKQLGVGKFGLTYLARDYDSNELVVIKRPNSSFQLDRDGEKAFRRFKREVQALERIKIANIVRVVEFAEIEQMPCIVTEFIEGETLSEYVCRKKFMPENEAWQFFQKLAVALDALHQKGIFHFDIHPENIMVQPNGNPILIDFGSTKFSWITKWTVTTTVNHFSPYEQALIESQKEASNSKVQSGENTGSMTTNMFSVVANQNNKVKVSNSHAAIDIYTLAANMFFATTGEIPLNATARKIYGDNNFKLPKQLKSDLSDRLNQTIIEGMALEANDRPASMNSWIEFFPTLQVYQIPENIPPLLSSLISCLFLIIGYFVAGLILGIQDWDGTGAGVWIESFIKAVSEAFIVAGSIALVIIGFIAGIYGKILLFISLFLKGEISEGKISIAVVTTLVITAIALAIAGSFAVYVVENLTEKINWITALSHIGTGFTGLIHNLSSIWTLTISFVINLLSGKVSIPAISSGDFRTFIYILFVWISLLFIVVGYTISPASKENDNYEYTSLIFKIFSPIILFLGGVFGSLLNHVETIIFP